MIFRSALFHLHEQRLFSEFFYLKAREESGAGIVVTGKVGRDLKSNVSGFIKDFLF